VIERFVKEQAARGLAPSTINRDLAVLRRALRCAQTWKILNRVPHVKLQPGERNRDFVLTCEQQAIYLGAAPEPLSDAASLMLETGLRVGEALALTWQDINLDPIDGRKFGWLQVRMGKTKNARRAISLTPRAVAMLTARRATAVNDLVFPGQSLDRPFLASSLSHQHVEVRDSLKLPKDFVLHSLRHTFLTRLGETCDPFTLMKIAGHASIVTSQRYIHPAGEAMERAFERLQESGENRGTQVGTRGKKRERTKHDKSFNKRKMGG
jgi:integrase